MRFEHTDEYKKVKAKQARDRYHIEEMQAKGVQKGKTFLRWINQADR